MRFSPERHDQRAVPAHRVPTNGGLGRVHCGEVGRHNCRQFLGHVFVHAVLWSTRNKVGVGWTGGVGVVTRTWVSFLCCSPGEMWVLDPIVFGCTRGCRQQDECDGEPHQGGSK